MFAQIALFSLIAIVATLAASAVKRIPEGHAYSLRRFGKPTRMLLPGTHMVLPLIDRVAHKISLAGHTLPVHETVAGTDAEPRTLQGLVYWQVLEPERVDAVIDQAEELIRRGTLEALDASDDPATETVSARNARLKQALNQKLRSRGVLVTRVDLSIAA